MFGNHKVNQIDHTSLEIAKAIWELFQISYQVEAELLALSVFPPLSRRVESIRECGSDFLGVKEDEKLIAAIEISKQEDALLINSLVVNPNYFRQGLATALVQQVLEDNASGIVRVCTATKNLRALSFYKKLGFVESGCFSCCDDIERVELKKTLRLSKPS